MISQTANAVSNSYTSSIQLAKEPIVRRFALLIKVRSRKISVFDQNPCWMSAPCCPPTFPAHQIRCAVQFSSRPSGPSASNTRSSEVPSSNRNRAETKSPPTREVNLARHIKRTTKSLLRRSCGCSCPLQISDCLFISSLSSRRSPSPLKMVSTLKLFAWRLLEVPSKVFACRMLCGSFEDGREFPTASSAKPSHFPMHRDSFIRTVSPNPTLSTVPGRGKC